MDVLLMIYPIVVIFMLALIFMRVRDSKIELTQEIDALRKEVSTLRYELRKCNEDKKDA